MVGAVLFAFLLGLSIGVLVGRRNPAAPRAEVAPAPVVAPSPLASGSVGPSKRGRKAGLTEADFTPTDDILERLRKAAEGELDPTELSAGPVSSTPTTEDEAVAARKAELAERERRVLERLKQLEAEDDGSRG